MSDLNTLDLTARLTRDPKLKQVGGSTVCEIGLASNDVFYTRNGEKKERVLFIDGECWGRRGESLAKCFSKGDPILVQASLVMDSWTDSSGAARIKHRLRIDKWYFFTGTSREPSPPPDDFGSLTENTDQNPF